MRLAVKGLQDTILTGNPVISYYQKIFTKRSTYTAEMLRLPFDSVIRFGGEAFCTIPNDTCDIITGFYLNFKYPKAQDIPQDAGHALVERAELMVGGQTIVSLTGEIISIQSNLTDDQRTRDNYNAMCLRSSSENVYGYSSSGKNFMIELPFFGKGYRNSFPLLALNRHSLQVRIYLRNESELPGVVLPQVEMFLQSIYLEREHRNFFLGRPLDYVIVQAQLARVTLGNLNQIRFITDFKNPVKELILVVQNDSGTEGVFDYSSHNSSVYSHYYNDQVDNWKMFLNGELYFDMDRLNSMAIQLYEHYTQAPTYKVNVFNVGQRIGGDPSGTINMSRISKQMFQLDLLDAPTTRTARLYAMSFNVFRCFGGLGGVLF